VGGLLGDSDGGGGAGGAGRGGGDGGTPAGLLGDSDAGATVRAVVTTVHRAGAGARRPDRQAGLSCT